MHTPRAKLQPVNGYVADIDMGAVDIDSDVASPDSSSSNF